MKPLVSVVLPVRDGGRYLDEALASIFGQTLSDYELIVVDDGSTDDTAAILARLSDERLRVVRTQRRGLVEALRRGLAEVGGTYVARMDADDVSEPTRLESQVALLEREPAVGMVATWTIVVDEQGGEVSRQVLPTRHEDLARRLLLRNPFTHGSVVLRRTAIAEAGGYRADYGANEDYDLWRRLGNRFRLACVPEALYRYRVHAGAVTATDPDRLRQRERLRDELWRADLVYSVRSAVQSGRAYRTLDDAVFRDHVADQRALAHEAIRRRRPLLATRALAAATVLATTAGPGRRRRA